MSRQFRYGVTAIVLGGFFLGVPLLTNGTASADQLGAGVRQATFEVSRISASSCGSRRVMPDCAPVVPLRAVGPTKPSGPGMLGGLTGPDGLHVREEPAFPAAGSARPSVTPSAVPPDRLRPSVERPRATPSSVRRTSVVNPPARPKVKRHHRPATRPKIRVKTKVKVKTSGGTAGGAPAVPGVEVPPLTLGPGPSAGAGAGAAPRTTATPAMSPSAAAEPVAAMRPLPMQNRVGLLGVIAAVCVLGVIIAAIRSIVSQRANRRIVA